MVEGLIRGEIKCKAKIVEYLRENKLLDRIPDLDAIDISGAVLAGSKWCDYCRELLPSQAIWRIALLEPDSYGAKIRARESTVWKGEVDMLNERIRERSGRIAELGRELGITVEIKYYQNVPVTRYMRLGSCYMESYYPMDCTGANTPLYVLAEGSILQKRVEKEFEMLWQSI